ncbi:hypothetical protein [Brevibacillus sp. NRS-1366]|uniref:hypothetical protein n=1 Tax=Brevibacillus sp. NRS-1366 TaxID=3233899 RepID=UPI003D25A335
MNVTKTLRGLSTIHFWAADLAEINIIYTDKNANSNLLPLIYAYIETNLDNYILSDLKLKSEIFPFNK